MKKSNLGKFLAKNAKTTNKVMQKLFPRKLTKSWLNSALGKSSLKYDIATCNKAMSEPIWDLLSRGGKKWRPALTLICCSAVGGNPNKITEFLSLPEFIHNGTLIVDDVEDNSLFRRGKKCIHCLYGIDVAVNVGNAMYFLPLILLYKSKNISDKIKSQIYDLYGQELVRLSFGQGLDIYWAKTRKLDVTEDEYLQMCYFKTGTLSRFSAKLGAILGGGNKKQIELLGDFAANIGVAFQIKDDLLNLQHNSRWGKKFGEDITEGKRTLMVIHALKHLKGKDRKQFLKIINSKTRGKNTISKAIKLMQEAGSLKYAQNKANSILTSSLLKLRDVIKNKKSLSQLKAFANYLVERSL